MKMHSRNGMHFHLTFQTSYNKQSMKRQTVSIKNIVIAVHPSSQEAMTSGSRCVILSAEWGFTPFIERVNNPSYRPGG